MPNTIVFIGKTCVKVALDGRVYREIAGEWREVKSGKLFSEAVKKAKNLTAIRASSDRRRA